MKRQLRVVLEVAVLSTLVNSLRFLDALLGNHVFNFFGSWGIYLGPLSAVVSFFLGLAPLLVGFFYGFRRRLNMNFIAVWIGWTIGVSLYSFAMLAVILPHAHRNGHGASIGAWLLWFTMTIALPLLLSVLPTLVTAWGQRVRRRMEERTGESGQQPCD